MSCMSRLAPAKGFTLIEILVVMGLFALLAGLGLMVSMDTYRGSSFRADRDLFVALLQHARAQAVNNICTGTCTDGAAHGVGVAAGAYTVFQGSSYGARDASQDQTFTASPMVTPSGDTEVVFEQLTGAVVSQRVIVLNGDGKVSTTTIETNGRIWWTN